MGNSTTKSLLKSNDLETPDKITSTPDDDTLSMYSFDEQKEILALRQQLNQDIKIEKNRILILSLEADKKWIIYLIKKMVEYNIKKNASDSTLKLIQKKFNPVTKTHKREIMVPYLTNAKIMKKSLLDNRNMIINNLSYYVTALKQHFGDDISYILQDHFDLTTYYQDFMKKKSKTKINLKNINWSALTTHDAFKIHTHYVEYYSQRECQFVVKPHPNKKGHLVFNANYLKLKKNTY